MIADKAIFLAPKVYALISNNKFIYKVKGLDTKLTLDKIIDDNRLTMDDFESLLMKDSSIKINHDKWYKSLEDSTITVKDQIYTLKVTSNKRNLIYDSNNKLINTKPYIIKNVD